MYNIFFLGHSDDEYDRIKQGLEMKSDCDKIHSISGNNINVKEFVKTKLKAIDMNVDYFILDVRALQNTEYTTILSFKANILSKYPELTAFLVIAKPSDGLSFEEYNDIIRNSVNGKNYILFSDSDVDNIVDDIVNYIKKDEIDKNPRKDIMTKKSEIKNVKSEISDISRDIEKISDNESVKSTKRKKGLEDKKWMASELLVAEEENEYNIKDDKKIKTSLQMDIGNKIWNSFDNTVILIGTNQGVGTSFVSISLAIHLSKMGAETSYVQFSGISDLSNLALDYSFINKGDYYQYKDTYFMENAFLEDMNYHVIDLGDNIKFLQRAKELGWLDGKRLMIVASGNHKGLKNLDRCIAKISQISDTYNVIMLNSILPKDMYKDYLKNSEIYFFEHTKRIEDNINSYTLSLIADYLYSLSKSE